MDKSIVLYIELNKSGVTDESLKIAKIASVIAAEYNLKLHLIAIIETEKLYKKIVNMVVEDLKGIPTDTIYFAYGKVPYSPTKYGQIIKIIRNKIGGDLILFPDTKANNPIASMCAAYNGSTLTKDCAGIAIGNDGMIILTIQGEKRLIDKIITESNRPAVVIINCEGINDKLFEETKHEFKRTKVMTKDYSFFAQERNPLSSYKGIIALGGGVKDKDLIQRVVEFCDKNNYGFASTKTLVEEGRAPFDSLIDINMNIKAECIIAYGVHGDDNFFKAIKDAERLVSVNSDKEAPINKVADEKIIGDVNEIILKMLKED